MNKEEKKAFEKAKIYVFNAITHCNFVKEKLIFSDRAFLTEQILVERVIYGDKGFNRISDAEFTLFYFFGKYKTNELMRKIEKLGER